jgi:hypothetical protein
LRGEKRIRSLQLFVPKQQALDPLREFLDRGHEAPAGEEEANCRRRRARNGAA